MADSDRHQHASQERSHNAHTPTRPVYDETAVPSSSTASLVTSTTALSLADPPAQSPPSTGAEGNINHHPDDSMTSPSLPSDTVNASSAHNPAIRPAPLQQTSSRRARVEDDVDEDDQRATNRQRLVSPGAGAEDVHHHWHPDLLEHAEQHQQAQDTQAGPPPPFTQPPPPRAGPAPFPLFNRIALTVDFLPTPPGTGGIPPANADQPPQPGEPRNQFAPLPFIPTAIELRLPLGPIPLPATDAAGNDDQQHAGNIPQPNSNPDINTYLQHLRDSIGLTPLGGLGIGGPPFHALPWNLFTGLDLEEPDDPGRAKRLLSGLDEVPDGLVKRMEQLGVRDGEMPVCAVCFDSLLEDAIGSEGSEDERPEHEDAMDVDIETTSSTSSTLSNDPAISSTASTSGTSVSGASTTSADNDIQPVDTSFDRKVFVLPCSHVFHGSCLRPWFTRPHRTTCPTCRFDIDPDSLTYVAPPPGRGYSREAARRELERARGRVRAQQMAAQAARLAANVEQPSATQTQSPTAEAPGVPTASIPHIAVPADVLPVPTPVPTQGMPNLPPTGPANPDEQRRRWRPPPEMPIGFIVDFSMIIPGPRASRPQTPSAQPQMQPAQPAGQPQPQPQPPAQMFGLPPPFAPGADAPPSAGFVRLDDAGLELVEQILRGIFGPLGGDRTNINTNSAPVTGTHAVPPGAAQETPRLPAATTQPPPVVTPTPLPSTAGSAGSGTLPGLGANIAGAGQGPLPSFEELMQFVDAHPPPAQTQPQPRQPPADAALPPTLGNFINSLASVLVQRIFSGIQPGFRLPGEGPTGAAPAPTQSTATSGSIRSQPPGPIPFTVPLNPRPRTARPAPTEKRQWTLPPPPGPTLRQRIEKRERELGLRCSDVSCGLGPSDDDPVPVVDPRTVRRISLTNLEKDNTDGNGHACEHTFHPSCLISAERVAGWNGADEKQDKEGEEEVQVSCPVCRAGGIISRKDWDEGACALA